MSRKCWVITQVRRRRRYSAQFKAELVAEYLAGGVSLASLAISHDINPNTIPSERSPASAKPHHPDKVPVHEKTEKSIYACRAYLWAYAPSIHEGLNAVIYDFTPSRAGAHARRKFYELHVANKSEIAAQALASFKALYAIEAEAKDLTAKEREQRRQEKARPILEKLHDWMLAQRTLVPDGSGTAKALDYSLKRWAALTRYLEDGYVPIDNNHIEQQIRPLALGRKNWLFAGSLRAGQRAAAVMTLIQSAKLNGHDPLADRGDILERLPTQPNPRSQELLPHHWQPAEQ